jgi:hypothetical protein
MTHSLQDEVSEVCQRHTGSAPAYRSDKKSLANDGDHFEVEQFGRHEMLTSQARAGTVTLHIVVRQRRSNHRRIDDDQPALRSSRTASLEKRKDTRPPLCRPARSRTSSRLGRRASSTRWPRRYSCNDFPAASARLRNSAWTSSGTDLIWTLGTVTIVAPFWRQMIEGLPSGHALPGVGGGASADGDVAEGAPSSYLDGVLCRCWTLTGIQKIAHMAEPGVQV